MGLAAQQHEEKVNNVRRLRQLSPGTVLGMIALFVALAGTATAGGVALIVTSANIKNGTIQLTDISPAAKRALKGKRGPAGPAGPSGLAGSTGPAGPAGPPGVQVLTRVNAWVSVEEGEYESVTAVCPAGMAPVSGGHAFPGEIWQSERVSNGWEVVGFNTNLSGDPFTLYVEAYCSPNVKIDALGSAPELTMAVMRKAAADRARNQP